MRGIVGLHNHNPSTEVHENWMCVYTNIKGFTKQSHIVEK